jgi:uncharacterized protein YceK
MKYWGFVVLVLAVIIVAGCAGIVPEKQAGQSAAQPKGGRKYRQYRMGG